MAKVHSSMGMYSDEFLAKLKRVNYSTPKNYLDFLKNYKSFLSEYKEKFQNLITRYEEGLDKLISSKNDVEIL